MLKQITYFEGVGEKYSERVFEIVVQRLAEGDIKKVVVASTRGHTAKLAVKRLKQSGVQLVVVPHQFGFKKENKFPGPLISDLKAKGHEVHIGTMLFHTTAFYGSDVPQVIANFLRAFGQGMKVCFEIMFMAADAGKFQIGEKILCIAGTNWGCDTAVVMRAYPSTQYRNARVMEILCKPLSG